jgi:hypothetical protein
MPWKERPVVEERIRFVLRLKGAVQYGHCGYFPKLKYHTKLLLGSDVCPTC